LGEQKLAKNDQDNQIQNITSKKNAIPYVFLQKVYALCSGVWGKARRNWGVSRFFVLKVTLQYVAQHLRFS